MTQDIYMMVGLAPPIGPDEALHTMRFEIRLSHSAVADIKEQLKAAGERATTIDFHFPLFDLQNIGGRSYDYRYEFNAHTTCRTKRTAQLDTLPKLHLTIENGDMYDLMIYVTSQKRDHYPVLFLEGKGWIE